MYVYISLSTLLIFFYTVFGWLVCDYDYSICYCCCYYYYKLRYDYSMWTCYRHIKDACSPWSTVCNCWRFFCCYRVSISSFKTVGDLQSFVANRFSVSSLKLYLSRGYDFLKDFDFNGGNHLRSSNVFIHAILGKRYMCTLVYQLLVTYPFPCVFWWTWYLVLNS